jgi:hypothetical protein
VSITKRYLDAVAGHDWAVAEECVAPGVRRVGPFGDVYEGRDAYLAFLRDLMPTLAGYSMTIHRTVESEGGSTVVVELNETVEMDGKVIDTPECLVFDLGDDGLIAGITIYIQRH